MSMFKAVKDIRRRVVETVLESVGSTERTTDEEFDKLYEKFNGMISSMKDVVKGLNEDFAHEKGMVNNCVGLSTSIDRIYKSGDKDDWPSSKNELTYPASAISYKKCWDAIQVIEETCQGVNVEQGLQPVTNAINDITPAIELNNKTRTTLVIDYDSYRRRLKGLEQAYDVAKAQSKQSKMDDAKNEMMRFERKKETAYEAYQNQNTKTKTDIIAAKRQHDQLMDTLLVTTVVCQYEMYSRAAKQLEEVMATLPPAKVQQLRQKIEEKVSYNSQKKTTSGKEETEVEIATPRQASSSLGNPFGSNSDSSKASAPTSPSPPTNSGHFVVALYDHVAEADDELNFKAGDKVEVLETIEGGWWKGRCKGNEGLFPVNYTKSA